MGDPCQCFECQALSTLAAWLWTDTWGADPDALQQGDDEALDRIIDSLQKHWLDGDDKSRTVAAVKADIATWLPRGSLVQ